MTCKNCKNSTATYCLNCMPNEYKRTTVKDLIQQQEREFREFVKESKTLGFDERDADYLEIRSFFISQKIELLEKVVEEVKKQKIEVKRFKQDDGDYGLWLVSEGNNSAVDKLISTLQETIKEINKYE